MKSLLFIVVFTALFILHQDVWFWRTARPLALGFLPIGLFYHACFTVAVSLALVCLVKYAWPAHLEREIDHTPESQRARDNKMSEEDGPN